MSRSVKALAEIIHDFNTSLNNYNKAVKFYQQSEWTEYNRAIREASLKVGTVIEDLCRKKLMENNLYKTSDKNKNRDPSFHEMVGTLKKEGIIDDGELADRYREYYEARNLIHRPYLNVMPTPGVVENALTDAHDAIKSHFQESQIEGLRNLDFAYWEKQSDYIPPSFVQLDRHIACRENELKNAQSILDDVAKSGNGRMILIRGESGSGKTFIAEAICRLADRKNFRISRYIFRNSLHGAAIFPLLEITRQISSSSDSSDEIERSLTGNPDVDRGLLLSKFSEFIYKPVLCLETQNRLPLLIFLDDIHHIDNFLVNALFALQSRFEEGPVLVIATSRTDISNDDYQPFSDFNRAIKNDGSNVCEMEISKFERKHMTEAVSSIIKNLKQPELRCNLPEFFYDRLHSETEGNALFMHEILRNLLENSTGQCTGLQEGEDGVFFFRGHDLDLQVPNTVAEVIEGRFEALDDNCQMLLQYAAVLGSEFSYEFLLALNTEMQKKIDDDVIEDALDALLSKGLMEESTKDTIRFSHRIIREVAYDKIPGRQKPRMHRTAAGIFFG